MKHALLVVGNEIKLNNLLLEFIFRSYKKYFFELGDVFFSQNSNSNLPFKIEELTQQYDNLTIYSSTQTFTLINKIIATLSEDNLSLISGNLIPSKVKNYHNGFYSININECTTNILHVQQNTIPEIQKINSKISSNIYIIDHDKIECERLLQSLNNKYSITSNVTNLVEHWLCVKVQAENKKNINKFTKEVNKIFEKKVFTCNDPIDYIVKCLDKNNKFISLAESCTGGLVSSALTEVPGVSRVYKGGLITYSNEIKKSWLGVDEETLHQYGAVSPETIKQMLSGVLRNSKCHIALAVSGIAGPDGGSEKKPVGTVFIGVANKDDYFIERLYLKGDRKHIQKQSVYHIFRLLLDLEPDIFFQK